MSATSHSGIRVAIGPAAPGWGSWEWVGHHLLTELPRDWIVTSFASGEVPDSEAVILIKHWPKREWLRALAPTQKVIYAPIDFFGSLGEIEGAAFDLRRCDRIVVHCRELERCFRGIAKTAYLDHPLKFVAAHSSPRTSGPLLWVGVTSNLPPLLAWLHQHVLEHELLVLSSFADDRPVPTAAELGLCSAPVRCERWSPERHLAVLPMVRGALDIKDEAFRSRHKPPAKALDFLASGVPLALQPDSSAARHLRELGFAVADPEDGAHWLSAEYAAECARFGGALKELLSPHRIALRWRWLIEDVLRQGRRSSE